MAPAIAYAPALPGGFLLLGQGRFAGWTVALGLPRSPAGAIAFLVAVLLVTYAFLTVFIKVGVPSTRSEEANDTEWEDEDDEAEPDETAERPEPTDERPDPDWDERAGPNDYGYPYTTEPPAPAAPALEVESVRVHGQLLSVGDAASDVMRAFRPGEGEMSPLVERNSAGQAAHITRAYRVGVQRITLTLERPEPDTPLRLTRILIGE